MYDWYAPINNGSCPKLNRIRKNSSLFKEGL